MPQMYLRRFASRPLVTTGKKANKQKAKARIRMVEARLGPSSGRTVGVADAAVETDFYTVDAADPRRAQEAEHIIGVVEQAAGYAFAHFDNSRDYFPDAVDRENLALFMALQFVRGPETGEFLTRMYTDVMRMMTRMSATQPDYIRSHLAERGEDSSDEAVARFAAMLEKGAGTLTVAPHRNDTVKTILESSHELVRYFFMRKWAVVRSRVPFLTSDRPIVLHERRDPHRPWEGSGLMTADMILFAIDRRRALVMQHPLPEHREGVVDISDEFVHDINHAIANGARRWLFHHPDDDPLDSLPFNPNPEPAPVPPSARQPPTERAAGTVDAQTEPDT